MFQHAVCRVTLTDYVTGCQKGGKCLFCLLLSVEPGLSCLFVAFFGLFDLLASAQTATGSIAGRIKDPLWRRGQWVCGRTRKCGHE